MIRSTKLPPHITEQMSRRTMNTSLAEEQRAVKKSESQKVRHDGEIMELRQRWGIERSLVLREGARDVAKVGTVVVHTQLKRRAFLRGYHTNMKQ